MSLEVVQVIDVNKGVYLNLAQAYEAEFSAITEKLPRHDGLFELDTPLDSDHAAYLALVDNVPIGFANIRLPNESDSNFEVCEFYIIPACRKTQRSSQLAHAVFTLHPGRWVIKQILGAEYATEFWRRAIQQFGVPFEQVKQVDDYWGPVTMQQFEVIG